VVTHITQPYGDLLSVACPLTTQCTAVDVGGHEYTFDPRAPAHRHARTIADNLLELTGSQSSLTAIACAAPAACAAVDSRGNAFSLSAPLPHTG
jgi:hypothetical protein